jgi:hypothetical protein
MVALGWRGMFIVTGLGALLWLVPWLITVPAEADFKRAATSESLPAGWTRAFEMPVLWALPAFAFLTLGLYRE